MLHQPTRHWSFVSRVIAVRYFFKNLARAATLMPKIVSSSRKFQKWPPVERGITGGRHVALPALRGRGRPVDSAAGRAGAGTSGEARKVAGLARFRATGARQGAGELPHHRSAGSGWHSALSKHDMRRGITGSPRSWCPATRSPSRAARPAATSLACALPALPHSVPGRHNSGACPLARPPIAPAWQ